MIYNSVQVIFILEVNCVTLCNELTLDLSGVCRWDLLDLTTSDFLTDIQIEVSYRIMCQGSVYCSQ